MAAARLLPPGISAAVVGAGSERFVTGDVVGTGHVDDGEFDRWLRRATCLVQLRATSNGESSGVVAHALARGVPLVVTDIGAMRELPDDVAIRVPPDVSAAELARVIRSLVDDVDRRAAMRESALAFARRHTSSTQADLVVAALRAATAPV